MTDTTTAGSGDAGDGSAGEHEASRSGSSRGRVGMRRFIRQVIAELKKVVYPTRSQLITYTTVVLVFVAVIMLYVSGLDYVFSRLVLWAFAG